MIDTPNKNNLSNDVGATFQSRELSKQSVRMLSAHNLAANAVGTDLVRFARCALRSVSPSRWGAPFFGAQGSFWVRLIGHPKLKMKKRDVSLRADEPLRAGLLRVADDLIDPGNRPRFVNSLPVLAFPKNLKPNLSASGPWQ
jgi:hypothetical protein